MNNCDVLCFLVDYFHFDSCGSRRCDASRPTRELVHFYYFVMFHVSYQMCVFVTGRHQKAVVRKRDPYENYQPYKMCSHFFTVCLVRYSATQFSPYSQISFVWYSGILLIRLFAPTLYVTYGEATQVQVCNGIILSTGLKSLGSLDCQEIIATLSWTFAICAKLIHNSRLASNCTVTGTVLANCSFRTNVCRCANVIL